MGALLKEDVHVRAAQRHVKPAWPGKVMPMLMLTDLKTCLDVTEHEGQAYSGSRLTFQTLIEITYDKHHLSLL